MSRITILVADDHPIVRDGLVAILSTQSDLEVVGEAGDGQEVVLEYQRLSKGAIKEFKRINDHAAMADKFEKILLKVI